MGGMTETTPEARALADFKVDCDYDGEFSVECQACGSQWYLKGRGLDEAVQVAQAHTC
jgi:hypothetical protein